MKKISKWMFSMTISGALLLIVALAIAFATLIESNYGTAAAKALIYKTWWFDALWILLTINMAGSIFKNKLYKKKKWAVLIFHLAFIIMVIGAGVTRYFGYESSMHIREGDSSNIIKTTDSYIGIEIKNDGHKINDDKKITFSAYSNKKFKKVYNINEHKIIVKKKIFIPSSNAIIAYISVDDSTKELLIYGRENLVGEFFNVEINGVKISLSYGSKNIKIPFLIKLNDFKLERYFGSQSPSSFISDVIVIDNEKSKKVRHSIFMNNVLNYRGYRFFQSSYDQDEKGTLLSVNHDFWGTTITYVGYFLMMLGFVLALFSRGSRFQELLRKTSKHKISKTIILLFIASASFLFSSPEIKAMQSDSTKTLNVIDKSHAESFGELLTLDSKGRIKPMHTVASEVSRKLMKKKSYKDLNPGQVFLGMLSEPNVWQYEKIIKISNPEVQKYIKINSNYASYIDLIEPGMSGYKIKDVVEEAYAKKPAQRNKFDKEVMKVDEKMNLCYNIFSGSILKIYPAKIGKDSYWFTIDKLKNQLSRDDYSSVQISISEYFNALWQANKSGDWTIANKNLQVLKDYQIKNGGVNIPSSYKVKLEILYNKSDIFNKLAKYFGILGLILLVLNFILIFKPNLNLKSVLLFAFYLALLLFVIHSLGLAVRWYISGHAPWSNGYESMLYVAWATSLSGLIFVKKSKITLAATSVLASLILFIANLSWMDPTISNLVPVLKSFWLIIHVAVITASYGFLALAALLGAINLIIMISRTKKNYSRIGITIDEISNIIKINIIIGLYLLTIGTFLGAIWANESWGRYWGWDPKESWALISILIYAFVVHMWKIPGLKGNYSISFGSFIAFGSILMTYFGVNYFLAGMHSYAGGEAISIPNGIYYGIGIVIILSIVAYFSEKSISEEDKSSLVNK